MAFRNLRVPVAQASLAETLKVMPAGMVGEASITVPLHHYRQDSLSDDPLGRSD